MQMLNIVFRFITFCFLGSAIQANAADTSPTQKSDVPDFAVVIEQIRIQGESALQNYTPETGSDTGDLFSDLYFDVFESSGMEMAIGLKDAQLKTELESHFSTVIGLAMRGESKSAVNEAWQTLLTRLQSTTALQNYSDTGFWALFTQAFLILLREGFEAILVVTALTTYLRRTGSADKLSVIYHGITIALLASLLTAYLLSTFIELSGAGQEALEGATMLIAAAVLFYVSYWLIAKREAGRWQRYVESKIDNALSSGKLFTLGFAAFLAVYREGAETVLFYQAMVSGVETNYSAVGLGAIGAAIGLMAIYWVMRSASFKLPITLFFTLTAGLLYVMAIIFTGKGVLELQEARLISITPLDGFPRIEWLGLFPTGESMAAQGLLITAALLAFCFLLLKKQAAVQTVEAKQASSNR